MAKRGSRFRSPKLSKPSVRANKRTGAKYELPEDALIDLGAHTSLVESRVARELTRRKEEWQSQVEKMGGRSSRGGMVLDFLLPARGLVIQIQGDYWHGTPGAKWKDAAQQVILLAQGLRVAHVWEYEIMDNVREAIGRALGDWA